MRSGRSGELRAVVAGVESLARRKLLTSTRMPAAFLQLQRNAEFWPTRSFPKQPQPERKPCTGGSGLGGARVTFEGDPIVFQWYPGQGLQIQPLANFGKANALWRACQPPTEPPQPGAEPPPPCRPEELRALLDRLVALASQRGGFTAWEYFFAFGGGTPPWISGLAQGTAIQALTRGSQLLGDPKYVEFARGALGAFERKPPLGVRAPSTSGVGRHYLIYSFSSGLRVLNGFLQSLVGLYDFADATKDKRAQRLFRTGDRAARREIPRYDTGAWSLYASGGSESDLGYHRLVRDFLQSLCDRTKTARVLRAGEAVRPLPPRADAGRLRRRRRGPPRRGCQRPLHALEALLRDAAGAARRQARPRAQARDAARPPRPHLPPHARRSLPRRGPGRRPPQPLHAGRAPAAGQAAQRKTRSSGMRP